MYAVMFEVLPASGAYQRYLDLAAALRPRLDTIDGFLSIERWRDLDNPGWLLSLSFWRDEQALAQWRGHAEHHAAQLEGRQTVFDDYRIRVVRFAPAADPAARVGLLQHRDADAPAAGKRYASLADQGKLVDLFDIDDGGCLSLPPDVLYGVVLRDYGMQRRAQAPQQFPVAAEQQEPK